MSLSTLSVLEEEQEEGREEPKEERREEGNQRREEGWVEGGGVGGGRDGEMEEEEWGGGGMGRRRSRRRGEGWGEGGGGGGERGGEGGGVGGRREGWGDGGGSIKVTLHPEYKQLSTPPTQPHQSRWQDVSGGPPHPQPPTGELLQEQEAQQKGELAAEDDDGSPRAPDEAAVLLEQPEPEGQQSWETREGNEDQTVI